MRDTQREAETQAEGAAGSLQEAQHRTWSQDPRITPWAKDRCSTTEPPRHPIHMSLPCVSSFSLNWKLPGAHSSHSGSRYKEFRSNHTDISKALTSLTFIYIPLTKASDMAETSWQDGNAIPSVPLENTCRHMWQKGVHNWKMKGYQTDAKILQKENKLVELLPPITEEEGWHWGGSGEPRGQSHKSQRIIPRTWNHRVYQPEFWNCLGVIPPFFSSLFEWEWL